MMKEKLYTNINTDDTDILGVWIQNLGIDKVEEYLANDILIEVKQKKGKKCLKK